MLTWQTCCSNYNNNWLTNHCENCFAMTSQESLENVGGLNVKIASLSLDTGIQISKFEICLSNSTFGHCNVMFTWTLLHFVFNIQRPNLPNCENLPIFHSFWHSPFILGVSFLMSNLYIRSRSLFISGEVLSSEQASKTFMIHVFCRYRGQISD